jgi:hypothetical protein
MNDLDSKFDYLVQLLLTIQAEQKQAYAEQKQAYAEQRQVLAQLRLDIWLNSLQSKPN